MLEVVFSDSAAGSMALASGGPGGCVAGTMGVIGCHEDGSPFTEAEAEEYRRQFEERERRAWAAAQPFESRRADILCFALALSVGGIAEEGIGPQREAAVAGLMHAFPAEGADAAAQLLARARQDLATLLTRAKTEPVRVWVSQNPDERCGLSWLAAQLETLGPEGPLGSYRPLGPDASDGPDGPDGPNGQNQPDGQTMPGAPEQSAQPDQPDQQNHPNQPVIPQVTVVELPEFLRLDWAPVALPGPVDWPDDRPVLVPEPERPGSVVASLTGWGEVEPPQFGRLAALGRPLPAGELRALARQWRLLQRENAPLRAVLNGRLLSLPETIYDPLIWREIEAQGKQFQEAVVVGRVLGRYQLGIGDGFCAQRIEAFIRQGLLQPVTEPGPDEAAYHRILRRCGDAAARPNLNWKG